MSPPFSFRLHEGWDDITDEVDGSPPPWTFARPDGDGAFQISIAGLYVSGKVPDPSSQDLMTMLLSSATAQDHEAATELLTEDGHLRIAAATFHSLEWHLRLWYFSDGYSVGQASLTTRSPIHPVDLVECESMVRSIQIAAQEERGLGCNGMAEWNDPSDLRLSEI